MKRVERSLANLKNALAALERAVATPPVEERDMAGIIKSFECTYELLWRTLQKILENNQISAPFPRVVFEESFKAHLIENTFLWKAMLSDRNLAAHVYDRDPAAKLCQTIAEAYVPLLRQAVVQIDFLGPAFGFQS